MSAVHDPLANAKLTGYWRPGLAARYDECRPRPHIARFERHGFRDTRELLLQQSEPCTAERWVACALTVYLVAHVLDLGLSDDALGLTAFRRETEQAFGGRELPWHVRYRVRVAIK
jgi:hypothetical protein